MLGRAFYILEVTLKSLLACVEPQVHPEMRFGVSYVFPGYTHKPACAFLFPRICLSFSMPAVNI